MAGNSKKLVVIGVDGIPPEMLERLMAEGRLPSIKSIKDSGVFGNLHSTILPITPPAWSASYTGKNPGKTGIYGFYRKDFGNYDWKLVDSRDIDCKTVWEIVSDLGGRSIVVGSPVAMPRKDFCGILLGGFPDYDRRSGIYPDSIRNYVLDDLGYDICSYNERNYDRFAESMKGRFETASYFLKNEKWDLFMIGFEQIEIAHHNLMGTSATVLSLYAEFDRQLGEFLKLLPDGCGVMMYSDHGTKYYHKAFHLTSWLVREGYLKVKSRDSIKAIHHERERQELFSLMKRFANPLKKTAVLLLYKADKFVKRHLSFVKKALPFLKSPNIIRPTEFDIVNSIYDYSASSAYHYEGAIGNYCGIYLNVRGRDASGIVSPGAEYDGLRSEIKSRLLKEEAVRRVWYKEELYSGSHLKEIFDIVVELNDGYNVALDESVDADKIIRDFNYSQHQLDGFILARGDGLRKGSAVSAEITGIMPTIMYILGLPVPSDADGCLIEGIFTQEKLSGQPLKKFTPDESAGIGFDYTPHDRKVMEQKLKSLGYL